MGCIDEVNIMTKHIYIYYINIYDMSIINIVLVT